MAGKAYRCGPAWLLSGAIIVPAAVILTLATFLEAAGGVEQRIFASAQQAVGAMVTAAGENNEVELLTILGPGAEDLVFSGDRVADRNGRARFLRAYGERNRLEQEDQGRMVLIVGKRDYPFPIPIVRRGEAWLFDTEAGREEVLSRRIGRNELHTIEVLQVYTDAQREYACLNRGGESEFARKFTSSEGRRDGLYWKAGEGEVQSPFGPLIARAAEEGYTGGLDEDPPEPFHGYYFKILEGQGEHAAGGAFDYVVDGRMILGFALVAYPAKYGASGIMTFIVNQEGVIYEKDLGPETDMTASAMTAFDPDHTWNIYREGPGRQRYERRGHSSVKQGPAATHFAFSTRWTARLTVE